MVWRRWRRSSDVAGWPLGAVALLALACIDVGQIRGPIGVDAGKPDANKVAADAGPPADAATDGPPDVANEDGPVDVASEDGPPPDGGPGSVGFGFPCSQHQDCEEGACVDGVCCRQGSCPVCQVCGAGGDCLRVGAGLVDPHFRCHPPDSPQSCGKSGACDGMGACAFYPANVNCMEGRCEGEATVVAARVCDGRGQCVGGPTIICLPYKCSAGTCRATCSSDLDCTAPAKCVQGSCGVKSVGAACASGQECVSGYCAQGVCCNEACRGPCFSCNLASTTGTCWPIEAGRPDPGASCVDQGPASCGTTGLCDGAGGCRRYDATTICKRTCAADGSAMTTSFCDGAGACGPETGGLTCPTKTCDAAMAVCQ
jgi:hypothetical protein